MIFNWFSNSTWDSDSEHDWEALKKQGTVTENIEEKDGFKTITRTFVSFDGSTKITSSESSLVIEKTKKRLMEIEKEIKAAVKNENYELAAELKKEKEQLTQKPK
jgi:excinuclease UvrABC helicase subunit UvrB